MSILFNPSNYDPKHYDEKTLDLMLKTIEWFEHKGLQSIKKDDHNRRWYDDFMKFLAESKAFAILLTPSGYGVEDSRYDLTRICEYSEILGFYGLNYQYAFQVSVLGTGPIWMSENQEQKKETGALLKEGHVFAFGLSEREHGADIYANEANIRPIGEGKYIANGSKYYIGNANVAPKVTTIGKNIETDEWVYWVVDSRNRHYKYVKDIETPGTQSARVGEYEMIEYPLTDRDILSTGDKAFADALSSVNIGKFQLGFCSVGMCEHALYEAINHANNRILYGKPVTNFPHIRKFFTEAYSRLVAMKLYALRSRDYFKSMSEDDRRYLLFNPIQKMKVTTQGEKVIKLLLDIIVAKAYEHDTYFENVVRSIGMIPRLEGTTHVNMALVIKFMKNYFYNNVDYQKIPKHIDASNDINIFKQTQGGLKKVKFPDYKRAFAGCQLPNVQIFLEQAEILKELIVKAAPDEKQSKNIDYMLNLGEIFTMIVYGQLVMEGAKHNDVDDIIIDQIFSYFVKDISGYALIQINGQENSVEQEDYLRKIMKKPAMNKEQEDKIWQEYVQVLDGKYVMNQ